MRLASRILIIGILAVVLGACSRTEQAAERTAVEMPEPEPINTLTSGEAAEGWQLLFDGTSTDAWRGYGREEFPSDSWKAEDGALMVVGTSGDMLGTDIVTKETFRDFELSLEFNVSPGGNSGIFYRVLEEEGMEIWQNAAEYQVLDDDAYVAEGARAEDAHLTAGNYDMHPANGGTAKPVGEWNLARILVRGNLVEHWLNGAKVVEYELGSEDWARRYAESKFVEYPRFSQAETAPIGLQDHGSQVWFRNIKIRRL
jgi:hypothetical protein